MTVHNQNKDQYLDEGGANETSAANVKSAYTHSTVTSGNPHNVGKPDVGLGNVPNIDCSDPSNISQSASYRFVSDTEKSTWNGKQDAIGYTPEDSSYKKTTLADDSDTYYPTQKAVKTAVDAKDDKNINTVNLTGSRSTLLTDAFKTLKYNDTGDINYTVEPVSSVAHSENTLIMFYQKGTGTITPVAGSGVTIRNVSATGGQYKQASLWLEDEASNEWVWSAE